MKFRERSKSMSTSSSDGDVSVDSDAASSSTVVRRRGSQSSHTRQHSFPEQRLVNFNSGLRLESRRRRLVEFTIAGEPLVVHENDDSGFQEDTVDVLTSEGAADVTSEVAADVTSEVAADVTSEVAADVNHMAAEASDVKWEDENLDEDSPVFLPPGGSDVIPAPAVESDAHPASHDRRYSETVAGVVLPWLPFQWLREPELFIPERRGVKRGRSKR